MKAFAAGLVVVLAIAGCSSSTPPPSQPTVAPRTEPIELPTLPAVTVPLTTIPVVTVTTAPAVTTTTTLPYGLTDADRVAVEATAIEWFTEVNRQTAKLPDFNPNRLFELAEPGSPAAAEYAAIFENLSKRRFLTVQGTINQTKVLTVEFKSKTAAEVLICTADNGGFTNADTGAIVEPTTLGRGRILLTVRKSSEWLLSTAVSIGEREKAKSCDDSF
jgi:hypothetical protein